ncbi:hypothetical protein QO179_23805 [Bacillus stercoris]|nr:hypothetical protein [Bacillus stercoris]
MQEKSEKELQEFFEDFMDAKRLGSRILDVEEGKTKPISVKSIDEAFDMIDKREKSVHEMEKELGIDLTIPATLTTENDIEDDVHYFEKMYEQELRKKYEE